MSTTFKVGDRVRRIKGGGDYAEDIGKHFVVKSVFKDGRSFNAEPDLNAAETTGLTSRNFELVSRAVPAPAEVDPNGVAANAPGSKLDAGKARPALVLGEFPRALAAVVDIGTFGAKKYTPRGWLSVPDGQERYADAAFRHQLKVWQGEKIDDGAGGTGGLHKAQVIWNLLAELELELRNG